jgi:hypothetical protein
MEGKITTQLSKTGTHFQSYIRRGLANIAAEEEEKERANVIAEAKKNLCNYFFNYNKNFMIFYSSLIIYHNLPLLVPQLNNNTENNINQSGGKIIIINS